MPIEPKFRGRSVMRKSAALLLTTLLAVGLMCAPASAQTDDDDDEPGAWIPIPVFVGIVGTGTQSSPSQKGNFRANLDRGGPRVHNPSVRLSATSRLGRIAIAEQRQFRPTRPPLLYPARARHLGLGRRF